MLEQQRPALQNIGYGRAWQGLADHTLFLVLIWLEVFKILKMTSLRHCTLFTQFLICEHGIVKLIFQSWKSNLRRLRITGN